MAGDFQADSLEDREDALRIDAILNPDDEGATHVQVIADFER